MEKFRFYFALFIAKIMYFIMKTTKLSSGTAILGLISLKICPNFLSFADKQFAKSKINITGTNGKTTTSGILTHLIKSDKKSIINNSMGANMLNGIINTLALEINPLKKVDYAVIETDEAFLSKVYDKWDGDYLLVTNLFPDQNDRFATPQVTKELIQNGIDKRPDAQLILNADDPLVATLRSKNKTPIYFGINSVTYENDIQESLDSTIYPCHCGKELKYSKRFVAQQGIYSCECGHSRPSLKYGVDVFIHKSHSIISINGEQFYIPLIGLFNAYNAIGAIVLAKELGVNGIQDNVKTYKVAFGRSEVKTINGHRTMIQLIKNPVGANEVLKTVDLNSNILIAINDNAADGTDISWINDTNFEKLAEAGKEIVVSGLRANDMAERLHKAGVKDIKIISNIKEAVDYIAKVADNDITILPTYTVLLKLNKMRRIKKCS